MKFFLSDRGAILPGAGAWEGTSNMPQPSVADEIAALDRLRTDGFLTAEEFAMQKDALLAIQGPLEAAQLMATELAKLAALVTAGTITRADFDRQKPALLWTETPAPMSEMSRPMKVPTTTPRAVAAPGAPTPTPRTAHKRRRVGVVAVLVVLAMWLIIAGASSKSKSTSSQRASSSTSPAAGSSVTSAPKVAVAKVTTTTAPGGPGIGQVAKDGDFAFVVKSTTCGASAAAAVYGGGYGETMPAGAQECLVTMTVTDDKSTAQTFFDSNQYGYDAKGHQFSADSNASLYLTGDKDDTQVNPGVTITAVVPFQIPATDKLTSLQLHDSAFSGGATVRL